jgi:hypothetical protein
VRQPHRKFPNDSYQYVTPAESLQAQNQRAAADRKRFGEEASGLVDLIGRCRCDGRDALPQEARRTSDDNIGCSASDRKGVPARPLQHIRRRFPDMQGVPSPSEAVHQDLTIGPHAADQAGARPYLHALFFTCLMPREGQPVRSSEKSGPVCPVDARTAGRPTARCGCAHFSTVPGSSHSTLELPG